MHNPDKEGRKDAKHIGRNVDLIERILNSDNCEEIVHKMRTAIKAFKSDRTIGIILFCRQGTHRSEAMRLDLTLAFKTMGAPSSESRPLSCREHC